MQTALHQHVAGNLRCVCGFALLHQRLNTLKFPFTGIYAVSMLCNLNGFFDVTRFEQTAAKEQPAGIEIRVMPDPLIEYFNCISLLS